MRLAAGLAVLFIAVSAPRAAEAATVSVVSGNTCGGDPECASHDGGSPYPIITYAGATGEVNTVAVNRTGDIVTIRDSSAPLTATAPCTAVDAHAVNCPPGGQKGGGRLVGFKASLGDGADQIAFETPLGTPTNVQGGDGADHVSGSSGVDVLDGGLGDDVIAGGPDDVLDYTSHRDPVSVDLAAGTGG